MCINMPGFQIRSAVFSNKIAVQREKFFTTAVAHNEVYLLPDIRLIRRHYGDLYYMKLPDEHLRLARFNSLSRIQQTMNARTFDNDVNLQLWPAGRNTGSFVFISFVCGTTFSSFHFPNESILSAQRATLFITLACCI